MKNWELPAVKALMKLEYWVATVLMTESAFESLDDSESWILLFIIRESNAINALPSALDMEEFGTSTVTTVPCGPGTSFVR